LVLEGVINLLYFIAFATRCRHVTFLNIAMVFLVSCNLCLI